MDIGNPRRLGRLFGHQAGAVTRAQLLAAGVTEQQVRAQVTARRWQLALPGIAVLFTGPLPERTRLWVATLHAGDDAVLSHETAAEAHGLRLRRSDDLVHVLVGHGRKVVVPEWIRLHRTRLPQPEHATSLAGLPLATCIQDTVLDLVDDSRSPRRALHCVMAACQGGLVTPAALLSAAGRRRRIRHRQLVKDVCAEIVTGVTTPLERRYTRDVEVAHGLPEGRHQFRDRLGNRPAFHDVLYDDYDLFVELDGRLGHEGEENAFRDRTRDNAAVERGRATLRFGWTDVATAPCETAGQVARVLQRSGWRGTPTRCGPTCSLPGGWLLRVG
jgi:hypothetical protein